MYYTYYREIFELMNVGMYANLQTKLMNDCIFAKLNSHRNNHVAHDGMVNAYSATDASADQRFVHA